MRTGLTVGYKDRNRAIHLTKMFFTTFQFHWNGRILRVGKRDAYDIPEPYG